MKVKASRSPLVHAQTLLARAFVNARPTNHPPRDNKARSISTALHSSLLFLSLVMLNTSARDSIASRILWNFTVGVLDA